MQPLVFQEVSQLFPKLPVYLVIIIGSKSKLTFAISDIGFLLNGKHYNNNSVVSSTDIGDSASALLCLTDNVTCCSDSDANWYLPSSETVQSTSYTDPIYLVRERNVVRLNKKNNATLPSGVFGCAIPDANGQLQNIYIGVYPEDSGAVEAKDLTFDNSKQALSCTSTGGPPTTVNWMKNGDPLNVSGTTYVQTQEVIDTNSSIYITTLFINVPDQNEVVGNYTCGVNNSRITFESYHQQNTKTSPVEIQGIFLYTKIKTLINI